MVDKLKNVKFKPIANVINPDMDEPNDAWHVKPNKEPIIINKGAHAVHVYGIPDDHGRTGYFKAKTNDIWQGHSHLGLKPFKSSIRDVSIIDREILASDIAEELKIKNIPLTKWARIKHHTGNLGKGSIHMDPHDLLTNRGFTRNQGSFHDWRAKNKIEHQHVLFSNLDHLDRTKPAGGHTEELADLPSTRIKSALKNGGIDLAFFDYIIGNADRHNNNYFAGTNPETGESTFIGSSHSFSFPHDTNFFYPDYVDSLRGLWRQIEVHGSDIEISPEFKTAITNPEITNKIKDLLDKSSLKPSERNGTIERLTKIQNLAMQNGKLTGKDLSELLKKCIYGTAKAHTKSD